METLLQDLRFGVRTLLKSPGFALVALLTLALGIGANSAIFSVVNAILLRPMAYKNPEQLMLINHNYLKISLKASVSAFGFAHYRDNAKSFESLSAITGWAANLTGEGEPERLMGQSVSANFFHLLGFEAAKGRTFAPGEDQEGKNRVVVLSHGFWQRRLGGDANVLNKTLSLNGENYTVVGVMPESFQFGREFGQVVDMWRPIVFTPDQLSSNSLTSEFLTVIARLRPGVSQQQAQAEMDTIAANLRGQYMQGADATFWALLLTSFREQVVGDIRTMLLIVLLVVGFVLLIACANVANLLLARAAARQKEITVRMAMGASRWRIIRQLLTESVLLAVTGGILGLVIGFWGVKALISLNADRIPRANEVTLDWRVLLFTFGVAILTGVLFGIVPALQTAKANLNETLKEGGRSAAATAKHWMRSTLVVAEIAMALAVLIGAGLLVKSFMQVQQVNPGFNPQGLLTMHLSLPDGKYSVAPQRADFYKQLVNDVRALPGVQSVGAVSDLPLSGSGSSGSFRIEGRDVPQNQSLPHGARWAATPEYFKTMGIPIIRGRYFEERDTADSAPVAIIDESLAKKYWPNEDPVGKRISFEGGANNRIWREIVGLVGHVKHTDLEGESRAQYYMPHSQRAQPRMALVIRTASDPNSLAGSVRGVIKAMDSDLPVFRVRTMDQFVADSMTQRRFALLLIGVFAGLAMLLAAIGLYGVMAYSVTQRTHELGLRMALGAQRSDVMKLVVRQGMLLAAIGLGLGVALALLLSRAMKTLLFNVSATDPLIYLLIAITLAAVALLACFIPARRATKVDPMVALRYE
ncbi:MAG TPA: ABC transporter permease [Blastocatellia bacterium]|nr:ABC transporter permease [Blastocatellia bacterium]HMY74010.1 ABC transporter permease [Blastocatellia bacterium]HMZ18349.1 ABC transporter permease [Blastocatellia bacterium]HNG31724.1 ABC transporter permease [Blastocatellia bacterium]